MGVTADIELRGGVVAAGAYLQALPRLVKVVGELDDTGKRAPTRHCVVYDIIAHKNQQTREDGSERALPIKTASGKIPDIDPDTVGNLYAAAYEHIKAADWAANVKDAIADAQSVEAEAEQASE